VSIELTLWAASVMPLDFDERIRAANAGGFTATSLFPFEVRRAEQAGVGMRELRDRFESSGVRIAVVDPLARWLPTWSRPQLPPRDPALGDFEPDELFAMCEALGADLISVLALFDPPVDPAQGAESFAVLCDRAAEHGVRLQLEFIPGTGIADLAKAWEIVRLADRPNGGLLADSWHFFRSSPDFELLSSIPADRVFALQLEDAPLTPAADVAHESLHGRLLPGEGELELTRFLNALPGAELPILSGPEVFSDELWARHRPEELGRTLAEATLTLLATRDRRGHNDTY
jgi:sugar phosphate isomerase/epimerase